MSRGVPGGARWTPVPDVFFSRFLPALADPVAVKVALYVLWRIHRRAGGRPPAVSEAELVADSTLRRGLATLGVEAADVPRRVAVAVTELVAAGWLLELPLADGTQSVRWLLVNTVEGRAARERLSKSAPAAEPVHAAPTPPERPNIFALYEDNIGLVTPLLAEELTEAEAEYPPLWIERAFRLAAEKNARNWRYVRAILERWARDGVDDEGHRRRAEAGRERDSEGPFGAWVER